LTVVAFAKVRLIHPLGWKASHLLFTSPSTALAAVSPGAFSALALTPATPDVTSPGMPALAGPVTPATFGAPLGPASTVLVQSRDR
jgi:hypothetical protein